MTTWLIIDDILIISLLAANGYFLWRIANVMGAFLEMPPE